MKARSHRFARKCFLGVSSSLALPMGALRARTTLAAEAYTMRLNHNVSATSVIGLAAAWFSAAVERRSNGQLKIETYPNAQLADEHASIDGLTTGVIDFAIHASTSLEPLFPRYQVFQAPFLFKNLVSANRVLDGPIGREFFSELESKGIVGLGWGYNGFQEIETTSKPIVAPEDMKGLRMRIQAGTVLAAMFQALGALPVIVDTAEVMTSLSQRVADGTAVSLDNFAMNKWYTVVKRVAMANQTLSINPLLGSKRKIEALPPNLQNIVRDEGKAVVPYWRALIVPKFADAVQFLKQNGVAFTEIQYQPFRKAMDPVYALIQGKVGGNLLDRVGRAANP